MQGPFRLPSQCIKLVLFTISLCVLVLMILMCQGPFRLPVMRLSCVQCYNVCLCQGPLKAVSLVLVHFLTSTGVTMLFHVVVPGPFITFACTFLILHCKCLFQSPFRLTLCTCVLMLLHVLVPGPFITCACCWALHYPCLLQGPLQLWRLPPAAAP